MPNIVNTGRHITPTKPKFLNKQRNKRKLHRNNQCAKHMIKSHRTGAWSLSTCTILK